jgi:hypothetical protein
MPSDIGNVFAAYAHYFDNQKIDEWLSLFGDDATWEVRVPGRQSVTMSKVQFGSFVRERFGRWAGSHRRHLFGGVFVESQTDDIAHAFAECLVGGTTPGKSFEALYTCEYEGRFRKINGEWKISRWFTAVDSTPLEAEAGELHDVLG